MVWIVYAARVLASSLLLLVAAVSLFGAMTDKKATAAAFGLSALFAIAGAFAWPRRPNAWRHEKPTERQMAFARDLGIRIPKGISKGDLSDLISQAKQIRDAF